MKIGAEGADLLPYRPSFHFGVCHHLECFPVLLIVQYAQEAVVAIEQFRRSGALDCRPQRSSSQQVQGRLL